MIVTIIVFQKTKLTQINVFCISVY